MRREPELRHTETYTESNFLRLFTAASPTSAERIVTLEHFFYRPAGPGRSGWECRTIIDKEPMSKEDAVFIAEAFAREHSIPVIYECHEG